MTMSSSRKWYWNENHVTTALKMCYNELKTMSKIAGHNVKKNWCLETAENNVKCKNKNSIILLKQTY